MATSKQKVSSNNNRFITWLGIAIIVLLIDQLTKLTISTTFQYAEFKYITSFFNLVLVYNEGAAFSFLANSTGWQRYFFTLLGLVVAVFIVYLLKKNTEKKRFCTALSLILGGAVGNVIDRVVHGHVIDFLDFHLNNAHWPAFNVADSAICVGAVLFVIDELCRVKK